MNAGYITFLISIILTYLLFQFTDPLSWEVREWVAFGTAAIILNLVGSVIGKLFAEY